MLSKEINKRRFLELSVGTVAGAIFAGFPIVNALNDLRGNNNTDEIITAPLPATKPTVESKASILKSEFAPVYSEQVNSWKEKTIEWSELYDVDPDIVAILMQIESNGDTTALGGNDCGLFQVNKDKFSEKENCFDPDTNARRGLGYFKERLVQSGGELGPAFAGYNGGHMATDWFIRNITRDDYVKFINTNYPQIGGEKKASRVENYVGKALLLYSNAKAWEEPLGKQLVTEKEGLTTLPYMIDQRDLVLNNPYINQYARWKMISPPTGILWHQVAKRPQNPDIFDGDAFINARKWDQPAYHFLIGTKVIANGYAECYWLQDTDFGVYHVLDGDPKRKTHIALSYLDSYYDGCPPTEYQIKTMMNLTPNLSNIFKINTSEVKGHKEVDEKGDPVGIDMNAIRLTL